MRVMLADDDRVSRQTLQTTLASWGYEVVTAYDGRSAMEILEAQDAPRMAILDCMTPAMDGLKILAEVRRRTDDGYTYVLVLTTRQEPWRLIRAIEAGADDYLTRPIVLQDLKVRLRAGKRIVELQADLLAAREALRVQSTQDALTGLWNRVAVMGAFQRELARASREGVGIGVVMGDIDRFRSINDTFGHPAGDQVLREVAQRIQSSIRCYDAAGRYGGEEFLIVLPNCAGGAARDVAARIGEAVRIRPVTARHVSIPVTISLGVTTEDLPGPDALEELLQRAERALYQAKDEGRDRVSCLPSPTGEQARSALG